MGSFGSTLTDVNASKSKVVVVCSCVHVSIFRRISVFFDLSDVLTHFRIFFVTLGI